MIKNIDGHPVERLLGSGAAGAVYLVRLPGRQRYAALKLLKGSVAPGEKLRFRREFGAIARCSHPGIISVYGNGDYKGSPYYLMEYIKGEELLTHIRQGLRELAPLPARKIPLLVDAGTKLLDALRYLHNHRIIHRDIKPANIMFTEAGEVKLFDFGLAWAPALQQAEFDPGGGTAGYQAPEQILGKPVDSRADLYSLGVCFYEILCGINPFGRIGSWQELLERQMAGRFNAPSRMNPDLNEDWDYLFSRLLATDPAGRFQSAGQVLLELKRIQDISITLDTEPGDENVREFFRPAFIDPGNMVESSVNFMKSQTASMVIHQGPSRSGATRFLEEIRILLDSDETVLFLDLRRYLDAMSAISALVTDLNRFIPTEQSPGGSRERLVKLIATFDGEQKHSPETGREIFLSNFVEYLKEISKSARVFLLIDNVDFSSDFLTMLLSRIMTVNGIHLAVTCITLEKKRFPAAHRVQWTPLKDEAAAAYLNDLLGTDQFTPEGAGIINGLAEGSPGRMRDILDGWILDGSLRIMHEQWVLSSPATPENVLLQNIESVAGEITVSAIRRTLPAGDRLDREILRTVAVFGHDCPFSLLTGVFAAREELLLDILDRLIRDMWLVEEVRGSETMYRFTTDEIRSHVYNGISPFHRGYLHRRLAEILSRGKTPDDAIEMIAHHHSVGDDPEQGLEYLEKAADIAARRFDTSRALQCYTHIQTISRLMIKNKPTAFPGPMDFAVCFDGISPRAMNGMYRNIQESSGINLEKAILLAARSKGLIYGRGGDYGQAFEEFQRMLASARDMASKEYEAMALINIGQIFYYQKKYEEAHKSFSESLTICESLGDDQNLGNCLNTLGAIAQRKNDLDLALKYYRRALTVKESLDDKKGIAYLKNNLGNILAMKKEYSDALEQFKDAHLILIERDDPIGIAYSQLNMGSAYHALEQYDNAVNHTEKALEIWGKMKNTRNSALCYEELGQIYIDSGRGAESVQYLQKAVACFEELGQQADARRCRKLISKI